MRPQTTRMVSESRNVTTVLMRSLKVITYLKTGRRSIDDIQQHMGCCRKTVYRYLQSMEMSNIPVIHQRLTREEYGCDHGGTPDTVWIDRSWTL